jgi:hypothetical protein
MKTTLPGARIYRPSFGHENARFAKTRPKRLFSIQSIRTQRCWLQLVSDEIRFAGSFQILEPRRGRDQLVFMLKEQPYWMANFYQN